MKLTVENILNRKHVKPVKGLINERHIDELEKICLLYDSKTIKNRINNIVSFIKYDVEGDWVDRLSIIQNELKNDVLSDYALEIRYGKNNVEEIKKTFNDKFGITKERYINKFGETEGELEWENFKIKSKTPWGLESCVERFGEIEGKLKWEERLSKKVKTMGERKKIKPYRSGQTLPEYQDRYGVEEGYRRWDLKNKKLSYRQSKLWYTNEYGVEDGEKRWLEYCRKQDNSSLKSYIKRHGKEEGLKLYNKFCDRLRYTSSKQYYLDKYGTKEGEIKYRKLLDSIRFKNKYSKISQELFWGIMETIGDVFGCYFAELNDEYTFYVWESWANLISVDFKLNNKIIEFDGDYWHSFEKQKLLDNKRDEYLQRRGYSILRIKECDYRENKKEVINKCVKFLLNE